MITKNNFKDLLVHLGYEEDNGKYFYKFLDTDCDITVDFNNEKIIYPTDKGLIVNERQTTNFSDNENFVVFECIHRLLEKGYKPSHIEIEKRWTLGHLQKSGRADICVMNATGNDMLFIIECKTYGEEFDKELKNLKNDGGQLFSYYQQEKSTKWLMLYASDYINGAVEHQIKTISVFDTEENIEKAEKDKSLDLYINSGSKEETFDTWVETYDQKMFDDLIFREDTVAYNIGEKPLRKKDLKEFNPKDKIVNKFEEILRHNNVSDKENAFNKLTALFICKLVDELTKDEEDIVDFQYKYGTDTYETLLDRLQRLYKEGMDKFMKEEIFYVSSEYPLNLFSTYRGQNRKNAIEDLKETFRKLKFYSNSDFAFKDVHNEELFQQNGKILVEVVKLFEHYKIVYASKHQFLGDLFEQLLNQGFKQNEGQFFTPIPITRFIWESLPIENLKSLTKENSYPKVIDYACGSGHFLTEGIDLINKVKGSSNNNWVGENIYGIEKDYRLARVSKISLFMNGAGEGNIIFGDGLDNHKDKGIENNSFDILVANPPYSVKAFKAYLTLKENDFKLTDFISNDGSEIEVLFVERIAQLLKPNGIAAVILPSSILSNTSNSYIAARDEILKNFKIKAISQFADKTFGATGTNTVVLFLEKYDEPPKYYKIIEDTIQAIFNNQKIDEWMDDEILDEYIDHIGMDKDLYISFIEEMLNYKDFKENEYFKMYVDNFENSTELKNLESRTSFKKLTEEEQDVKRNNLFYLNIKEIEKEKLFYFSLVREQNTLVVKAPTNATEQYEYLGYQWSKRKGSEGIQIKKLGGILYDAEIRNSREHIAPIIRKVFDDKLDYIDDGLNKYVSVLNTKNMLDFERDDFNCTINLVEKENIKIYSKYEQRNIINIIKTIESGSRPRGGASAKDTGFISLGGEHIDNENGRLNLDNLKYVSKDFFESQSTGKVKRNDILICKDGARTGKIALVRKDFNKNIMINEHLFLLRDSELVNKYVFYLLYSEKGQQIIKSKITGSAQGGLNKTNLENIKIPVPPTEIQKKIVSECENLEKVYESTRMKIEDYKLQIQKIFEKLDVIKSDGGGYKLSELAIIFNPSKDEIKNIEDIDVSFIPMEYISEEGTILNSEVKNIDQLRAGSYKYFKNNDILIAKITPCMENGKCAIARDLINGIGFGSSEYHVLRCDNSIILPEILFGFLNRDKIRYEAANNMTGASGHRRVPINFYKNLKINLPTMDEQKEILNKLYEMERKINELRENQIDLNKEIGKVLDNYLI